MYGSPRPVRWGLAPYRSYQGICAISRFVRRDGNPPSKLWSMTPGVPESLAPRGRGHESPPENGIGVLREVPSGSELWRGFMHEDRWNA